MDNEFSETTNINDPNNDIILPNSLDLDWAQINYVINCTRLLFIDNYKTWLCFHNENGYKYHDYTPEELSNRFLQRILPNIYEYELLEDELHLLDLLNLHPNFVRIEKGFNLLEKNEKLSFPLHEAVMEIFLTQHTDSSNVTNFVGKNVESNHQILVTGTTEESHIHRKFLFNTENAALLSVALCTDEYLPNCEILTIEEIRKLLKTAKIDFQNSGKQLENINNPIDVLLKKLQTLYILKEAVTKLVDKSFRRLHEI